MRELSLCYKGVVFGDKFPSGIYRQRIGCPVHLIELDLDFHVSLIIYFNSENQGFDPTMFIIKWLVSVFHAVSLEEFERNCIYSTVLEGKNKPKEFYIV